jgi:hypothetical protein
MNATIEKDLSKIKSHIIDHATLSTILLNNGYTSVKDKINNLKKKGILLTLKKGLYIHKSQYTQNIISKEMIANSILAPSYISFDYALYYHSLIPESVHDVVSATIKRSKSFDTDYGIFKYRQTKKELFPIGLKIEASKNGNFIIASKEKALCDKLYFTKDIHISSKRSMIDFLQNDLRIDFEEIEDFDIGTIKQYFNISKSKKIEILMQVLKDFDQ